MSGWEANVSHFFTDFYFYAARGAGVWINVGKSERAYNKIDALLKLGVDPELLVTVLKNERYYSGPHKQFDQVCYGNRSTEVDPNNGCMYGDLIPKGMSTADAIARLKDAASPTGSLAGQPSYCSNRRAMLCGRALNLDDATWARLLGPNWKPYLASQNVGTSPHLFPISRVYADTLMRILAQKKKLRTLQLTTQPNSNGGWAFELIYMAPTPLQMPKWYPALNQFLSYRSPCRRDKEFELKRDPCVFDPVARMSAAGNATGSNIYRCIYCPIGWRRDGSKVHNYCRRPRRTTKATTKAATPSPKK